MLDGQIAGLRALEDLVHQARGATVQIGVADAIRHQSARLDILARSVDSRQALARRQICNQLPVLLGSGIDADEQAFNTRIRGLFKGTADVLLAANVEQFGLDT